MSFISGKPNPLVIVELQGIMHIDLLFDAIIASLRYLVTSNGLLIGISFSIPRIHYDVEAS